MPFLPPNQQRQSTEGTIILMINESFIFFYQINKQTGSQVYLDCLFLCGSSTAKMCTVPWSLATQIKDESPLKLILQHIARDSSKEMNKIDEIITFTEFHLALATDNWHNTALIH